MMFRYHETGISPTRRSAGEGHREHGLRGRHRRRLLLPGHLVGGELLVERHARVLPVRPDDEAQGVAHRTATHALARRTVAATARHLVEQRQQPLVGRVVRVELHRVALDVGVVVDATQPLELLGAELVAQPLAELHVSLLGGHLRVVDHGIGQDKLQPIA